MGMWSIVVGIVGAIVGMVVVGWAKVGAGVGVFVTVV
jgi:hypothetical protein